MIRTSLTTRPYSWAAPLRCLFCLPFLLLFILSAARMPVFAACIPGSAADIPGSAAETTERAAHDSGQTAVQNQTALVTTDLYVRSGPSANHQAIAIAHKDETVPILQMTGSGWVQIRVKKDGTDVEGYVNSAFLDFPEGAIIETPKEGSASETGTEQENTMSDTGTEAPASRIGQNSPAPLFPPSPQYLWIGDSRTQALALYVKQDIYCAAESADLKWLKGEGREQVLQALDSFSQDTVILSMGINDLNDANGYIRYFRTLSRRYPDKQFWVMSVGPVNEETEAANGYTVQNSAIEEMNAAFQKAFPDRFLNIYTWMRQTGFASNDGVHYSPENCRKLSLYVHLSLPLHRLLSALIRK